MKPKLYMLPLEPLPERYTGQWYKWLPDTFRCHFEVAQILGQPLEKRIKVGHFLDLNSTAHYKATQLAKVAKLFHEKKVKNGDSFWVSDIEFWGIESIRYLARLQGIKIFMFGFLHAGSYTKDDFMEPMADIGRFVEPAWVAAFDRVYVGSDYHRAKFCKHRLAPLNAQALEDRFVVTGNPWRAKEAQAMVKGQGRRIERDIDVLFPHRPDLGKRPGVFLKWLGDFHVNKWHTSLRAVFTTPRRRYDQCDDPATAKTIMAYAKQFRHDTSVLVNVDRRAFYELLGRSKVVVSTAVEENYGYAMVEAMSLGATPLMPNAFSYPELVAGLSGPSKYLYTGQEEFDTKLNWLLRNADFRTRIEVRHAADRLGDAEQKILHDMQVAIL